MRHSCISETGSVRLVNEDAFLIRSSEHVQLYLVADGMGGFANGDLASRMAVDIFANWWELHQMDIFINWSDEALIFKLIRQAFELTNEAIRKQIVLTGLQMGTTLSVAIVVYNLAYVVHIGDSRIYLYRNQRLEQVTSDDTKSNYDLSRGLITQEAFMNIKNDHILVKCLGFEAEIYPQFYKINIKIGDQLIACTDGVHNYYVKSDFERFLHETVWMSLNKRLKKLSNSITELGAHDNYTLILVKI